MTCEAPNVGWVTGAAARADRGRRCSSTSLPKEARTKALGAEVLHLYREINLIYSFSEKLAALLDLDRVAALTLQEARQLIAGTDGAIMLLDEATGVLTTIAGFGDEWPRSSTSARARHHRRRSWRPASARSSTTSSAIRAASSSTRP